MSEPNIAAEWIEKKRHYLFWRDGERWAYTRLHGGDRRRWDVFDARYAKILEILAPTREEAAEHVTAMILDGSLQRLMEQRQQQDSAARDLANGLDTYQRDDDAAGFPDGSGGADIEALKARLRILLDEYAETPGARQLISALRRTAGLDRDDDQHGRVAGQHTLVLPFPRPAD